MNLNIQKKKQTNKQNQTHTYTAIDMALIANWTIKIQQS